MDLATTMSPCYLPILRAKRGEIQALGALAPRTKDRVRPLIDIPKQRENDKRTLSQYLCDTICSFPSTWGTGRPLYFDMPLFAANARMDDDEHPIERVFEIAN